MHLRDFEVLRGTWQKVRLSEVHIYEKVRFVEDGSVTSFITQSEPYENESGVWEIQAGKPDVVEDLNK